MESVIIDFILWTFWYCKLQTGIIDLVCYSTFTAQGLSSLSVRDFLKSIQLENLVELFEREQVG